MLMMIGCVGGRHINVGGRAILCLNLSYKKQNYISPVPLSSFINNNTTIIYKAP